ncbi:protein GLUTAMINE DUMPER 2 [Lactuca sativa]|uniref:protein GLUTAMINE DUMPER 2 n=1 Tax=Lactuca sativa TaxID=4236 RepID=UPI000CD992D3|nr:protein GLUTAMINE DUMPER 2 [Lactuca sativa]
MLMHVVPLHLYMLPFLLCNFQRTAHTVQGSRMGQQLENTTPMESLRSSTSWRLDTPLVYLFCGIGAMLALILMALIMLACSQWRTQSTPTGAGDDIEGGDEHPQKVARYVSNESKVSPEIVVVMAGDQLPSYLAAPARVPGCSGTITHLSDRSR